MQFLTVALATLFASASAQVPISLPSGVPPPSGVTLPTGVSVVTAGATSTAQANANKRFHKRQAAGGSISGLSNISIGLQQTSTKTSSKTN